MEPPNMEFVLEYYVGKVDQRLGGQLSRMLQSPCCQKCPRDYSEVWGDNGKKGALKQ